MKYINRKALKNISLSLGLLLMLSTFNNAYAGSGDATTYEITITKIEICESSDGASTCTNPLTIGSSSKDFDIASASVGAEIGTYAPLNTIPKGTTATHMRVTMSRSIDVSGYVDVVGLGTCYTDSGGAAGTATTAGIGVLNTNGSIQTLFIPNVGAIGGQPDATAYTNNNITLLDGGTEISMIQSFGKTVTMGDIPPAIDLAFNTEGALQAFNGGGACWMIPGAPTVEMTITEFD